MTIDDRKITELRNLGPACERNLHAVGIYTAEDIRRLGVEETFVRVMQSRIGREDGGGSCFNAVLLYALYGALEDCDWREIPAEKKAEFKALTARLRRKYTTGKTTK